MMYHSRLLVLKVMIHKMADTSASEIKMRVKTIKQVFVTVGTTKFDELIATVASESVCKILKSLGYQKLLLQIGACDFIPPADSGGLAIEHYKYKPSIQEDIENASFIISHAGAGCCLESLGAEKPLLVVINDALMNNHQLELAQQLHRDGHIYYCNCRTLESTLQDLDLSKLVPFPPGNPEIFANYLDKKMGFA